MTFATAQNRLFPMYVAVFSTTLFGLLTAYRPHDVRAVAAAFPDRPGRRPLAVYLGAVALALTLAWLMAVGGAQLLGGVEPTVAQIVAKTATFAVLTPVAGGLLVRLVLSVERHSS